MKKITFILSTIFTLLIIFALIGLRLLTEFPKESLFIGTIISIVVFAIINYYCIKNKIYGYARCSIYAMLFLTFLTFIICLFYDVTNPIEYILYSVYILVGLILILLKEKDCLKLFLFISVFIICVRLLHDVLPPFIWPLLTLAFSIKENFFDKNDSSNNTK